MKKTSNKGAQKKWEMHKKIIASYGRENMKPVGYSAFCERLKNGRSVSSAIRTPNRFKKDENFKMKMNKLNVKKGHKKVMHQVNLKINKEDVEKAIIEAYGMIFNHDERSEEMTYIMQYYKKDGEIVKDFKQVCSQKGILTVEKISQFQFNTATKEWIFDFEQIAAIAITGSLLYLFIQALNGLFQCVFFN